MIVITKNEENTHSVRKNCLAYMNNTQWIANQSKNAKIFYQVLLQIKLKIILINKFKN